jgi:fructose 1,6-bisphosphatase
MQLAGELVAIRGGVGEMLLAKRRDALVVSIVTGRVADRDHRAAMVGIQPPECVGVLYLGNAQPAGQVRLSASGVPVAGHTLEPVVLPDNDGRIVAAAKRSHQGIITAIGVGRRGRPQ